MIYLLAEVVLVSPFAAVGPIRRRAQRRVAAEIAELREIGEYWARIRSTS